MTMERESRTVCRRLCGWIPAAAILLIVVWAYGQWSRDRSWLEGLLFYIPTPLVCGALAVSGLLALKSRWRRQHLLLYGFLGAAPLYTVIAVENQWFAPSSPGSSDSGAIRMVHWNVCHGGLGWPDQCAELLLSDAELIIVSEPPLTAAD